MYTLFILQGCPPVLETLMTKCWNKDISVRPSMEEVATQMAFLAQFFPGSNEPIKFLEIGQTSDFFLHSFVVFF